MKIGLVFLVDCPEGDSNALRRFVLAIGTPSPLTVALPLRLFSWEEAQSEFRTELQFCHPLPRRLDILIDSGSLVSNPFRWDAVLEKNDGCRLELFCAFCVRLWAALNESTKSRVMTVATSFREQRQDSSSRCQERIWEKSSI